MPEHHFDTPSPVDLVVEINKGLVHITCTPTAQTTVVVEGKNADTVAVEQRGDTISVTEPGRGRIFGDNSLHVTVVVPQASHPSVRTGSADIRIQGRAGHGQLRTGSGDVSADTFENHLLVETGSGETYVADVCGDLKVKSGSGDVAVGSAAAAVAVSTGSGDVAVEQAMGTTVVKTGSGDVHLGTTHGDASFSTGSGDCVVDHAHRGRISVKGASGDVRVGIVAGVPVWTDLATVSGVIDSNLTGAGQPAEGQDHVELRAKTVSGDIVLVEA